jgi:hypothetical protein
VPFFSSSNNLNSSFLQASRVDNQDVAFSNWRSVRTNPCRESLFSILECPTYSSTSRPNLDMSSQTLGELARFPAEVRKIIWQNIGPQNNSGPKSSMSILRTYRQLYNEVEPILYDKEVLCFKVSPQYQYRSWISASNRCGATWTLESFDGAIAHCYDKLP